MTDGCHAMASRVHAITLALESNGGSAAGSGVFHKDWERVLKIADVGWVRRRGRKAEMP
uniref:Uncharacterized protein n=1 Tax=Candidatus Kentrum sp. FM TaxID=2126340 RepID=A0A450RZ28_9GAMM|nr:MAG: hypothetical protein BECKFM1743A_GA0114220_100143 [Candidatus Kentron sp. FM]VFJ44522.1 MAG: hypothetical protein BECKFM1743C_GA0114222_100125 [Candidatus Kentron sp. FM]VFK05983.1 MAG: hypothetical protein BECKFM1743B_GA0114221_1000810 [Candidatus Kentron sp. FM]